MLPIPGENLKDHMLVHLINERGFYNAVEVGVAGGNLTKRVMQNCPSIEIYYAVDPWKVYIESYHRPPHAKERQQEWWDSLYERVLKIAEEFAPRIEVMRTTSVEASKIFDDYQLDIVYIDAVHDLVNIVNDIYFWLPKIRNNGIISGHDYIASFKEMAQCISNIFEDDLNLLIVNPDLPQLAYKNTFQGGNWWVDIASEKREKYLRKVETEYGHLINYQDRHRELLPDWDIE